MGMLAHTSMWGNKAGSCMVSIGPTMQKLDPENEPSLLETIG